MSRLARAGVAMAQKRVAISERKRMITEEVYRIGEREGVRLLRLSINHGSICA
jgi:hypothetical protein